MFKKPLNKIIIIIVLVLFVPILTYTIYQVVLYDENEELIQSIYDRQLESIILSVNQNCYDVVANWHSEMIAAAIVDFQHLTDPRHTPQIGTLTELDRTPMIVAAFSRFSSEYYHIGFSSRQQPVYISPRDIMTRMNQIIADSSESLRMTVKFANNDYIKPVTVDWSSPDFDYTILVFALLNKIFPGDGLIFGGLVIDDTYFINEYVERRINALTDGEFIFAVQKNAQDDYFYYSTEEPPTGPFELSESLWILDGMKLKIKMAGTTMERLARDHARNNIFFLIIVNIVFIIGMLYVIRNVSKEMELAKIKSNLVANVSHEIRTPVALIRMYAETLEMGRIVDEVKKNKYYKTILAETVRLSQLINNMLDFSKIESKKKEYRMSANDLSRILHQVLDMYHYNFEQNGFRIEQKVTSNLPYVNIDPEAITQATINLLDNAMKYSHDNKHILVSLEQHGNNIILSVQDHGIGIPESEHTKIFQKFYRVGDSLVHNTKGSGLGLSLVEHIMKVHRGKVTLRSKPGQGSTFSLVFPIYNQSGA